MAELSLKKAAEALKFVRRFSRDVGGVVTVEFIPWVGVIVVLLGITADASKLYLTQADMNNVARDTARRMSTGQFCSATDAQSYAQNKMLFSNLTYNYNITFSGTDDVVDITTPLGSASVYGWVNQALQDAGTTNPVIEAKAVMPAEPGACQ